MKEMEGPGKETSIVEKDVMGETSDTSSHDADQNIVKATNTENYEMDTDNSCEETSVVESNSKSNVLIVTGKNNCDILLPESHNDQDASDDNCNIINETSNEYLAEDNNIFKTENTDEMNTDRQSKSNVTFTCNAAMERNMETSEMNVQGISEQSSSSSGNEKIQNYVMTENRENNGNTVADVSSNISEENNVEAMITDDTLDSREIPNELNIKTAVMGNDSAEKSKKPVVSDANNLNLDVAENPKTVNEKDLNPLKLICDYGSDSDNNEDDCIIDSVISLNSSSVNKVPVVNPCPAITQDYRKPEAVATSESEEESDSSEDESSSSSSTVTSSSSSDESDDSDNSSENECVVIEEKKQSTKLPKTKGELGLEDLPPIEDLHISVPESECVEIGKVLSIVDSLVVVQSMKGCPALDLDSILFLDNGHNTLGHVFDVFGKVGEACYCVRFNSNDHAVEKGIKIGMPVYYAPRTEHSKFVFLADLLKMKGSDASWEHNNEPPTKYLDFSDDEQERHARRKDKPVTRDVEPDETQPQNKRFQRRGPKRDGMGSEQKPRVNPDRSWRTPFNRYPSPSPSQTPSPRPGSQPLIRPPSFRASGPPPAHFYNAAAGASAVPQHPSPWAVPPPAVREDFNYNMNITNTLPPQSQIAQNQMRPGGFNMGVGSFGQPPPPPPPSPASRNHLMPTSIPGSGPFLTSFTNVPRPSTPSPFTSLPPYFGPGNRQNTGAQGSFPSTNPIFMNCNVPPPRPPQGW